MFSARSQPLAQRSVIAPSALVAHARPVHSKHMAARRSLIANPASQMSLLLAR